MAYRDNFLARLNYTINEECDERVDTTSFCYYLAIVKELCTLNGSIILNQKKKGVDLDQIRDC